MVFLSTTMLLSSKDPLRASIWAKRALPHLNVKLWPDIQNLFSKEETYNWDLDYISCVEQIICAHGMKISYFYIHKQESSFSQPTNLLYRNILSG